MLNEKKNFNKQSILLIAFTILFIINIQPVEAGIIDWWCQSVGWLCNQTNAERSFGVTQGYWIKTEKHSGIEKFLFYNIQKNKVGNDLVIDADVNKTVYNFLKDAHFNPTLQKCFKIQSFIQDDFPNFDCNKASDRLILKNRLQDYIQNGWQLLQNGIDKGFIDVNKTHITITIPNIKNRDRVKLGQFSLVEEYQDINLINYKSDWFDNNITLFINEGGIWNNTANDVWVKSNNKFGANVTKTNNTFFKYLLESDNILSKKGNFIYYISKETRKRCGQFICVDEERHEFDFTDICRIRKEIFFNNVTQEIDGNVLFDPQCKVNQTDTNTLEVTFWGEYNSTLGYILVDPTVTISDVSDVLSTLSNITKEDNFTHLSFGDTNIDFINDTNLVLYLPFDVNQTKNVSDYSTGNNDFSLVDGSHINDSGYLGKGMVFDGINDYLWDEAGNNAAVTGSSLTVALWVKANEAAGGGQTTQQWLYKTGAANDNGYRLFWLKSNPRFRFRAPDLSSPNCNSPSVGFGAGEWHHFAATYDGTNVKLYMDSILNKTCASTGSITDDGEFTLIGAEPSFAQSSMINGTLDEIIVLNTSLSQSQITDLYNNQSSRFFPKGTQDFIETNVSGTGSELFVNITINSTQDFSSILNISIGNTSVGDYIYYPEVSFTNNIINDVPIGTPNNMSLRFSFYAGNSSINSFITPNLINDILLVSFGGAATDSCSYSSGNYVVDCADDCNIVSNIAIDTGSNITISGTGTFVVDGANITNFVDFNMIGTSTTNRCEGFIINGGSIG